MICPPVPTTLICCADAIPAENEMIFIFIILVLLLSISTYKDVLSLLLS